MLLSFVAIVRVGRFVLVGAIPRFLYSVLTPELPVSAIGVPLLGLSGSLTLRDCPPSHDDWKTLREALFFRLRRKGLYRLHWLTEWQKRGFLTFTLQHGFCNQLLLSISINQLYRILNLLRFYLT